MKITTTEGMLAVTSFLLGKLHTGLYLALQEDDLDKLAKLEAEIRQEIEALYYPTRDPSATE